MRYPQASIYYWLNTKYGGQMVSNAKQARDFMKEVETWSDEEFQRATIEGDFGKAELFTKEELIAKLWDYAVGPAVQ